MRTQFKQARKKLREDEMDILYTNRMNYLATFKQADGSSPVYVWGNNTLQLADTALTDINVRRLLLYTQRLIEDVGLPLLFDQNDEAVRRKFENKVNPILANIRNERGLIDFKVVLDRSNEAFSSNEMKGKIQIAPTRALEYINIEFVLTPAGVSVTS
jgi:phage tail sheath protein FI